MILFILSMLLGCGAFGICVSIGSIPEECGSNPGGRTPKVWVIAYSDVLTFPSVSVDGITITADIVPKTGGKGWAVWEEPLNQNDYKIKGEGEPGNQSISHEANGYVSRLSKTRSLVFQNMLNQKVLVLIEDGDDMRLLGNFKRPVTFTYETSSGNAGKDKKGTAFKFLGDGYDHEPYYYEGVVTLAT